MYLTQKLIINKQLTYPIQNKLKINDSSRVKCLKIALSSLIDQSYIPAFCNKYQTKLLIFLQTYVILYFNSKQNETSRWRTP